MNGPLLPKKNSHQSAAAAAATAAAAAAAATVDGGNDSEKAGDMADRQFHMDPRTNKRGGEIAKRKKGKVQNSGN
jgi:hypothetical protein